MAPRRRFHPSPAKMRRFHALCLATIAWEVPLALWLLGFIRPLD